MQSEAHTPAVNVHMGQAAALPLAVRLGQFLSPLLLAAADYFAVVAAIYSAAWLRGTFLPKLFPALLPFHFGHTYIYFVIPVVYLTFIAAQGLYTKRLPFWQGAGLLFKACNYVIILVIGIVYFLKTGHVSRIFTVAVWGLSFAYLAASRYVLKHLLARAGLWQKPVIIVGAGKTAELLAGAFAADPYIGYKVAGLIEDNYADRPLTRQYPYLGTFDQAERIIAASDIKDVIIAAPGLNRDRLLALVNRLQPHVSSLTVVPDVCGLPLAGMEVETLFNEKLVLLKLRNNLALLHNRLLKRAFDIAASVVGGIFILPLLLVIAAAIYLDSPGPVIFSHQRIGQNGRPFPCYKFRSMVANAQEVLESYLAQNPAAREEWERDFKLRDDPRVTRVGKFLRKTSLDELPQIINVICGEMSLVGPRPIVEQEVVKYGEYINDYYLVPPGITGLWQTSGRNDVDYETRVQMDSWYVRNWSPWLDIVLLFRTIKVILKGEGAY
ncbi:Undecaprenyl-phosphate galactose phosphotransferase [Thermosinus carboxydivorans Nor1]|uniref:Undecaprenyl-phosphate galactose phosphotransferase n=1 Tax=Thermosinus carboxydivorans Nor1 TaxID=401526 RepID=A1HMC8_9FIRM|nr:undecaprenyl-phosphate galactose phosphotransferase WbaP [Thermosinus carboxydivorans]EAX48972.1 Undecaprenyl-phosphate galactose phosphotransferase [Thermosinus carboxydivorans Nor1]